MQDKETFHRVIVGRDFYEPQGIEPQATVQRTIAFLLKNKVPRQTEGACGDWVGPGGEFGGRIGGGCAWEDRWVGVPLPPPRLFSRLDLIVISPASVQIACAPRCSCCSSAPSLSSMPHDPSTLTMVG